MELLKSHHRAQFVRRMKNYHTVGKQGNGPSAELSYIISPVHSQPNIVYTKSQNSFDSNKRYM